MASCLLNDEQYKQAVEELRGHGLINKANALSWARMSSENVSGYTMSEMGGAYDNLIV